MWTAIHNKSTAHCLIGHRVFCDSWTYGVRRQFQHQNVVHAPQRRTAAENFNHPKARRAAPRRGGRHSRQAHRAEICSATASCAAEAPPWPGMRRCPPRATPRSRPSRRSRRRRIPPGPASPPNPHRDKNTYEGGANLKTWAGCATPQLRVRLARAVTSQRHSCRFPLQPTCPKAVTAGRAAAAAAPYGLPHLAQRAVHPCVVGLLAPCPRLLLWGVLLQIDTAAAARLLGRHALHRRRRRIAAAVAGECGCRRWFTAASATRLERRRGQRSASVAGFTNRRGSRCFSSTVANPKP